MKASDIFAAIRAKYPQNALVPEVVINNFDAKEALAADEKPIYQRRIDALMFQSLERTAIEIKVSRADFKREHSGKWLPWARVCHKFIYAVPEGLVTQGEAVEFSGMYSAGVWFVGEDGRITVGRKAAINKHPEPLPQHVIQALAYRATPAMAGDQHQQTSIDDLGALA